MVDVGEDAVEYAAWRRAAEHASMLFAWHQARHLGIDHEDHHNYVHTRPGIERQWAWQKRILTAVLCLAARRGDSTVDDITLSDAAKTQARISVGELNDALEASRQVLRDVNLPDARRRPDVLASVGHILNAFATDEGRAKRRLGYVIREMRAEPQSFSLRGREYGGWADSVSIVRNYISKSTTMRASGDWIVDDADRRAARAVTLIRPTCDYPSSPQPGEEHHPSWLQRAYRLTALADTLNAVKATLPHRPGGRPLAMVLSGCAFACQDLIPSVGELDRLWSDTVLPLPAWEAEHVPPTLVEQTVAIEDLVHEVDEFLRGIAGPDVDAE
ncbi:hypothetical protein [Streptomyces sp. NPDC002851]